MLPVEQHQAAERGPSQRFLNAKKFSGLIRVNNRSAEHEHNEINNFKTARALLNERPRVRGSHTHGGLKAK
jgi:hypothetical protein